MTGIGRKNEKAAIYYNLHCADSANKILYSN